MQKNYIWFVTLCLIIPFQIKSGVLNVIPVNLTKESPIFDTIEVENFYNFDYPVDSDLFYETNYKPSQDNRYFKSVFGPRFKYSSSSNIGYFDFHKGEDISSDVSFGGIDYSSVNPPPIKSMCNGTVNEINYDPNESSGKWVFIMCDKNFSVANWGNVYIAYRHLSKINVKINQRINKGDEIGIMGDTGSSASTVHLHLSVWRYSQNAGFVSVHPMRIFDTENKTHLISSMVEEPRIELLEYNSTNALFRIHFPYNQTNIRAIRASLSEEDWSKTYDLEFVSEFVPSSIIDNNNVIEGLEIFTYKFNRGMPSYQAYIQNLENLTIDFPASNLTDNNHFYPILPYENITSVNYTMDVRVTDLPISFDINNLFIEVYDIWGKGYRAYGNNIIQYSNLHTFVEPNDDAEESYNGHVDLSSSDLELVEDGGGQVVGLQFDASPIYKDSKILYASIQFSTDEINHEDTNLQIKLEDSSSPRQYLESIDENDLNHDISNRPTIELEKSWNNIPVWNEINSITTMQRTPDLSSLIQALVERKDWETGNKKLSFVISGVGKRVADSGDSGSLYKRPSLYIKFNTNFDEGDLIFANNFE